MNTNFHEATVPGSDITIVSIFFQMKWRFLEAEQFFQSHTLSK